MNCRTIQLIAAIAIWCATTSAGEVISTARLTDRSDIEYLNTLARDTWRCIDNLADPKTGMPFDSSDRGESTSVSNIGIYLTCIVVARDMGFITADEAEQRLNRTLASVAKLRTWHGFQQCWNDVHTLKPSGHDRAISILDSGNFAGGLITVARAVPACSQRAERIAQAMRWGDFYDKGSGLLIGGFKTDTESFVKEWKLASLGYDSQLAQFLAIASGGAPPEMWEKLDRSTTTHCGATFMQPGWEGGGLFLQYINGLWLDNRGTFLARSARNYAFAQIMHARQINSPAWGRSSCASPDGKSYLGSGALVDEVVTPHAVALALEDFPAEALRSLREMEARGLRSHDEGFYDSINLKTGETSKKFLVLDQGMLLIALGNYLRDDCVRRYFQSDPTVKRGRELIGEYRELRYKNGGGELPDANQRL